MGELRLLLGSSGTGKTYRAVSILKEHLRRKEEQKVLLLVSSKAHRNRIKDMVLEDISCYYSLPVYTFNGFSAEVIKRNERAVRTVSDIYRQILLEKIVDENVLEYYEEVKTFPGFTSALISFMDELKQGLIKPDEFLESFKKIKNLLPAEFNAKYEDLFFLYDAYQNNLKKFSLKDNADLAAEAVELIAGNPAVFPDVEELIIDGFYEFTPVQWKMIKLLKSFVSKTTITLSVDEEKPHLFQVQMETLEKLKEMEY
ncbi:MAG: hypothetical protein M1536_09380 [Firmicutes bacterium]|nr:hypothetical protein [Bacillota bacterium]